MWENKFISLFVPSCFAMCVFLSMMTFKSTFLPGIKAHFGQMVLQFVGVSGLDSNYCDKSRISDKVIGQQKTQDTQILTTPL